MHFSALTLYLSPFFALALSFRAPTMGFSILWERMEATFRTSWRGRVGVLRRGIWNTQQRIAIRRRKHKQAKS